MFPFKCTWENKGFDFRYGPDGSRKSVANSTVKSTKPINHKKDSLRKKGYSDAEGTNHQVIPTNLDDLAVLVVLLKLLFKLKKLN